MGYVGGMWEVCGALSFWKRRKTDEQHEQALHFLLKSTTFRLVAAFKTVQLSTLLASVGRWLGRRAIQHLGMPHFRVLWFLDIIWISLYHLSGLSTWFHSISPLITELNSNVDHALCFQGYVGGSCTCSCPIDQDFGRCYPLPNTMTFERWRFGQEAWAWDSTWLTKSKTTYYHVSHWNVKWHGVVVYGSRSLRLKDILLYLGWRHVWERSLGPCSELILWRRA